MMRSLCFGVFLILRICFEVCHIFFSAESLTLRLEFPGARLRRTSSNPVHSVEANSKMVRPPGLEPGTSCTPNNEYQSYIGGAVVAYTLRD